MGWGGGGEETREEAGGIGTYIPLDDGPCGGPRTGDGTVPPWRSWSWREAPPWEMVAAVGAGGGHGKSR